MDAIALYSEWESSPDAKELAKIFDKPQSHGRMKIKHIDNGPLIGDIIKVNDNCNLRFNKGGKTYEIRLNRIIAVHNYTDGQRQPVSLSIENGENWLTLLMFEENETEAFLAIEFDSGSIMTNVNNRFVSRDF